MFILLLTLNVLSTSCYPEAGYEMFPGFEPKATTALKATTSLRVTSDETTAIEPPKLESHKNLTVVTSRSWQNYRDVTLPKRKVRLDCPETETPSNIGPYEVPTERDLVLHIINTLHRLFTSYHQKAMMFLDDIGKVVAVTDKTVDKCRGDKTAYRQCVRQVSNICKGITKSLTSSLEQQRQDILAVGHNSICSLRAMKADPVKLIKVLASEEASIEFALPGFLRLLNTCNSHCLSQTSGNKKKLKPPRHFSTHLSDTDVVVRHFLTKKNYVSILEPKNNVYNIPIPNKNRRNL